MQRPDFYLEGSGGAAKGTQTALYVCYVHFKQAFDRVPRHLLWGKLERVGITGWALRAVQALYVDVPMCVKSPTGYTRCLQASRGVKQGCPLSPTLFGLYIDDFAEGFAGRCGGRRGGTADLGVRCACATTFLCR